MTYAKPSNTNMRLPSISASDLLYESYSGSSVHSTHTHSSITEQASTIWKNYLSSTSGSQIFMSLALDNPLALSTFIAANTNNKKLFIPSTYKMNKILGSIRTSMTDSAVVDNEMYSVVPPKSKANEAENIKTVLVGHEG